MSSQIKMTYDADSSSNLLICYKHVDSISCDLRVLFGWPLWVSWYMNPFVLFQTNTTNQRITAPPEVGSVATGADTFTFLMIHYLGKRFLEAFIFALIAVWPGGWGPAFICFFFFPFLFFLVVFLVLKKEMDLEKITWNMCHFAHFSCLFAGLNRLFGRHASSKGCWSAILSTLLLCHPLLDLFSRAFFLNVKTMQCSNWLAQLVRWSCHTTCTSIVGFAKSARDSSPDFFQKRKQPDTKTSQKSPTKNRHELSCFLNLIFLGEVRVTDLTQSMYNKPTNIALWTLQWLLPFPSWSMQRWSQLLLLAFSALHVPDWKMVL